MKNQVKRSLTSCSDTDYSFIQDVQNYGGRRCLSNTDLMMKGINYQFSLKDLPKYSKRLNSRDLDDRFSKTVMGRKVPTLAERIR